MVIVEGFRYSTAMTETLLLSLKITIVALIVAIGMDSTLRDLAHVWQRPGLLVRSLLAMYVLVPLEAFFLVRVLPLTPAIKAALLVFAVSAGAPLLPRKFRNSSSDKYVFSLVVASSLLAIILVPAWVSLLVARFEMAAEVDMSRVAAVMAKAFLVPLAVGMAIRAAFPGIAQRVADRTLAIAEMALGACAIALIVANWEQFRHATGKGVLALLIVMLVALAIGHLLGGPNPDDRTALAAACATRHLGIAIVVAMAFPGTRTATVTAVYIVTAAAVLIPYLMWRRHAPKLAAAGDR